MVTRETVTAERIRVLIADDHAIVREGLRALIDTEPDMELAGEAANGVEAVEKALALQPDVVLLDLVMPRKDGIEAITEIKQENPDARILVLTSFAEEQKLFPAIKAGALGYLLKGSSPNELIRAIREVYEGESSLDPTVARKLIKEFASPASETPTEENLSDRELEVLDLVAHGLSNQDIAERLVLSERTVRTHVCHILDKLHLASRTQAALYALRKGWSSLEPNSPN